MNAQQAMTARTVKVWDKLIAASTAGDIASVDCNSTATTGASANDYTLVNGDGKGLNQGDSGDINGGGSVGPVFKKALNAVSRKINKDTLGACGPKDMCIIMNPTAADAISRSKELHTYLKESPIALAQVRGDSDSINGKYGLPDKLYGYDIIIEDVVQVTNKEGAVRVANYVLGDSDVFVLVGPGIS